MKLNHQNNRFFGIITGFIALFLLFPCILTAQTADTLVRKDTTKVVEMEDIVVTDHTIETQVIRQKLPTYTENISTLLANQSALHIRNYNAGGVSSASYRGHSAAQIQVQWQGFSINSPMHGQSDLSLVEIPFTNQVRIENGIESVASGSGGLGGKISFNAQKPRFKEKSVSLLASQNIGSFGNFHSTLQVQYHLPKFNSITTISNKIAKNDYPYTWEGQTLRLQHANLNQQSIQQAFYGKLKKGHNVSAHLWLYRADRNIPDIAGSVDTFNTHHQFDRGIRANINYQKYIKKLGKISFHSAYFNEFIDYDDDPSSFESVKNRLQYQSVFKKFQVYVKGYNEFLWAHSQNYENPPHRRQFGASTEVIYRYKHWIAKGLLLKEWTNDFKNLPLLPTFSLKYKTLFDWKWDIAYNVGKNYRYPTFNELYWAQGGNTALVAESGWSHEANFNAILKDLKINFTAYYGNIDNWIQWTPAETGYWTAQNLKKVRKQGVETVLTYRLSNYKSNKFTFLFLYTYTQATNQETTNPLDQSLGKQLIYVPLHQGKFSVQYRDSKDRFHSEITQLLVGQRFVTSDNSQSLPAYALTNLSAAYTFPLKKHKLTTILQLNNIFNTQYQTIAQRPMMGRNYGFRVLFVW